MKANLNAMQEAHARLVAVRGYSDRAINERQQARNEWADLVDCNWEEIVLALTERDGLIRQAAAAPDLLAALQIAQGTLAIMIHRARTKTATTDIISGAEADLMEIRAAIAKATGGNK